MARELGWPTLLGMGATTAAVLVISGAVGWLLDRLFGTSPILVLVGVAFGIVGATFYTIAQFRKYLKN